MRTAAALIPSPWPDPVMIRFRRRSIAALLALAAITIMWIYGSTAYNGGRDQGADLVRALLGLAVFIAGGIVLVAWLVSLREVVRERRRSP